MPQVANAFGERPDLRDAGQLFRQIPRGGRHLQADLQDGGEQSLVTGIAGQQRRSLAEFPGSADVTGK